MTGRAPLRAGRRACLRACAGLLLGVGSASGRAEGKKKLPKWSVSYQDHPRGPRDCATCVHFIEAANPIAAGRCSVVAGPIVPHGYCMVWAPRDPTEGC